MFYVLRKIVSLFKKLTLVMNQNHSSALPGDVKYSLVEKGHYLGFETIGDEVRSTMEASHRTEVVQTNSSTFFKRRKNDNETVEINMSRTQS